MKKLKPEDIYTNDQGWQSKIQIRPINKEVINFLLNEIAKRKDIHIFKEKKLKTGIDFYVTNQKVARTLGKKLKDRFKGKLKITKTIYGRDRLTSKDIYRGTVCFRLE